MDRLNEEWDSIMGSAGQGAFFVRKAARLVTLLIAVSILSFSGQLVSDRSGTGLYRR